MVFSYGFELNGIKYGWHRRHIYRLPYHDGKRFFSLREIKPFRTGTAVCYNIKKVKYTMGRLKTLTTKVQWEVNNISNQDVP